MDKVCKYHEKMAYQVQFLYEDRKQFLEQKQKAREKIHTYVRWGLTTLVSIGLLAATLYGYASTI